MDFRVLGQVAVGETVLPRRRERDLLALLLAVRGAVPVERILEELWATDSNRASVQVAVSRLRSLLDPGHDGPRGLEMTAAGYRLVADDVDAWRFEEAAERALALTSPTDRLVLATRAAELWSGEPYPGVAAPSVRAEATRLEELHLALQEARAEALVGLGHGAAGVRVLTPLASAHPYREQLWALLARAQFACSRQADALVTVATLRRRLAEDLGVDPSPMVRLLEQRILNQDAGLAGTPVPAPRGPRTEVHVGRHARRVRLRHCRVSSASPTPAG